MGIRDQAIDRSRGGSTTGIVVLVDGPRNLVRFVLLAQQRHDMVGVEPLLADVDFDMLLADKAFDADWLRAERDERGTVAVMPPKSNRKEVFDCDLHACRRHLVEKFFCTRKQYRRIATRYDKTDESFNAMICLAAFAIALC